MHDMRYPILTTERDIDKRLVERVQQGDKMAFDLLVTKYQRKLFRLVLRLVTNQTEAEDVVQETFIKAYRSFPSFRGDCSEKTWLMRIAVNTCRDMIHSAWFRHLDRRITPEQLPESCERADEDAVDLTIEVMRLSQKHREVILLYYYENMTTDEIAQALGVAKSTVSVRLEQGRQNLRKMLERRRSHG